MAQRTLVLSRTLRDFANTPLVGATVTAAPLVPNTAIAIDGNGDAVQSKAISTLSVSDGSWSLVVDYPGDFATPNVQIRIVENGTIIDSPVGGFSYAATIDPTAWVTAVSTSGKVQMRLVYTTDGGGPVGGAAITIQINQTATDPNGATLAASSANSIKGVTDSDGAFLFWVWPTSLLNPTTTFYTARISGESGTITFVAPTSADAWQGLWDGGVTYTGANGTSAGDVVSDGGALYRYINATPSAGHATSDATRWLALTVPPTDLVTQHFNPGSFTGTTSTQTVNISHDSAVPALTGDPVSSPANLHDDLTNLVARIHRNGVARKLYLSEQAS